MTGGAGAGESYRDNLVFDAFERGPEHGRVGRGVLGGMERSSPQFLPESVVAAKLNDDGSLTIYVDKSATSH